MFVQAEYLWIDGTEPTALLRSKTKMLHITYPGHISRLPGDEDDALDIRFKVSEFPVWGFDGSSTNQAEGADSDCILKPVRVVRDPIRGDVNVLVLCEVFNGDGETPHPSNTRARLREVLDAGGKAQDAWFGFEQEYTFFEGTRPLGFPTEGYPAPQGPYYCGVGADDVHGRPLVEAHAKACMEAGLHICGVNAEVMPGQWEFQMGGPGAGALAASDHLWIARWILYRLGEDYGINATLDPKPARGDWNGAGMHTNFSTEATRTAPNEKNPNLPHGTPQGMEAIEAICKRIGEKRQAHLDMYGHGYQHRLTGAFETASFKDFSFGVADRTASIRIPRQVATDGHGYLEDRRPNANADPYEVCTALLRTVCGLWK